MTSGLLILVRAVLLLLCSRQRTGNRLGRVIYVQLLIESRRNRLNLSTKLLLDLVKVESILPVDKVDCQTKMTKSTRTANTMEVCLRIFGEIEVDNHIHSLNVDTPGKQVRAYQVSANTVPKFMEDTVAVILKHLGM